MSTQLRAGDRVLLVDNRPGADRRPGPCGIIARQTGIPEQNIIISASHTHTGGPCLTTFMAVADPDYAMQVANGIAADNFSPGNVGLVLPIDVLMPAIGFVCLGSRTKIRKRERATAT